MAAPDIILNIWGIEPLKTNEAVSQLHQTVEDVLESTVFRESKVYVSSAGSLHTKAERIHNSLIPSSPYYDVLRTGGLSVCMDWIAALYVADGGTLAEWVAMSLAERCEWIQSYTT